MSQSESPGNLERIRAGFEQIAVEERQKEEIEQREEEGIDDAIAQREYATGDIYDSESAGNSAQEWEISTDGRPYLAHVKSLASLWPSLKLLSDFMEVGTHPERWHSLLLGYPHSPSSRAAEVEKRARRTKVTRLDYLPSGVIVEKEFTESEKLREGLHDESNFEEGRFRLFVVEDLSRDVIELLGDHLDIEPDFFREQIFDYTWYNPRDRWVDPPRMKSIVKNQRWLRFRYPTIRYYKTSEDSMKAAKEFEAFNVFRRPEIDIDNNSIWDKAEANIGIARSRASLWISGEGNAGNAKGTVGVLLVDPSPTAGHPLWGGYRNWENTPRLRPSEESTTARSGPLRQSMYGDMVYWVKKPQAFKYSKAQSDSGLYADIPLQALTHFVAAHWNEASEYIHTRLGQLEWEGAFPEHFSIKSSTASSLKKLYIWVRLVPIYRAMLSETLERAFQFPNRNTAVRGKGNSKTRHKPIEMMREDFKGLLRKFQEHQQHVNTLNSMITAAISLEDTQVAREDNKNVARLTWLATFFVPLSFMASLFSVTEDIAAIRRTIKVYFVISVPLALALVALVWMTTRKSIRKFMERQAWRAKVVYQVMRRKTH